MPSEKMFEQFFEEHFNTSSGLFLYKDKKLLKQKDYAEFARHQLKKSRKNFRGGILFFIALIILSGLYFTIHLREPDPVSFNLIIALVYFTGAFTGLILLVKEHYSIKASMNLLLKMLNEQTSDTEEPADLLVNMK